MARAGYVGTDYSGSIRMWFLRVNYVFNDWLLASFFVLTKSFKPKAIRSAASSYDLILDI